jgi:hypothetical protein
LGTPIAGMGHQGWESEVSNQNDVIPAVLRRDSEIF